VQGGLCAAGAGAPADGKSEPPEPA